VARFLWFTVYMLVNTMVATQHYTSSPGAAHWATMKAGLTAGA